ncbi:ArsR/SmtB family transcription factor [Chloroflexota bacterium]
MITTTLTQEINQLHADICSALADPTRLIILYLLADGTRNVTDLTIELDLAQPTVSRHLKTLRTRGLVTANRQGTNIHYELADERVIEALDLLRSVLRDRIEYQANLILEPH